ncbi:MAG: glycosyltransferase family 4 protein, partial [Bacteroidota bacterium]|nr:glycosyltransferase family 4 protein [Bacteroidota bacterium]
TNGSGGGVFSVISNLLRFSKNKNIRNHVIFTINKETNPCFTLPELFGEAGSTVFYYSPKWNFYYTCRKLAKLLPDDKSIIVAHDWLELGMVSSLGLQNPLVHFVHGNYDYYYELAKKHEEITDQFITISPVIYHKLGLLLPHRKQDIHFRRFPVPQAELLKKENKILKIFYCVRSLVDENKQFRLLPLINVRLQAKGIQVHWTIIGEGIDIENIKTKMEQEEGIATFPSLSNDEVCKLLPEQDLFILPSIKEGFPVSLVEAMKAGVVPLVSNWDGATDELIIPSQTGYYFAIGDTDGYADKVALLNTDRKLLKQISQQATTKANELFDPYLNTKSIEEIIAATHNQFTKPKKTNKVYGSRLDQSWMPNLLTKTIRSIK